MEEHEDKVVCVIEKPGCIYEFIQGPTSEEYEKEMYQVLAKAIYESYIRGRLS